MESSDDSVEDSSVLYVVCFGEINRNDFVLWVGLRRCLEDLVLMKLSSELVEISVSDLDDFLIMGDDGRRRLLLRNLVSKSSLLQSISMKASNISISGVISTIKNNK
jgi:hypothetical protein